MADELAISLDGLGVYNEKVLKPELNKRPVINGKGDTLIGFDIIKSPFKLGIDDQDNYGYYKNEELIPFSADNNFTVVNNILYYNNQPIQFLANTAIYLDGDNGDDDIADGTEEHPFKTFQKYIERTPVSSGGKSVTVYVTGTFTEKLIRFIGGTDGGGLAVYFINNPTFCRLDIFAQIIEIHGSFTLDYSLDSSLPDYASLLTIARQSQVIYYDGTITIKGKKTSPIIRGIDVQSQSFLWLAYFYNGKVICQTCETGLFVESFGSVAHQYGDNTSMITYTNCTTTEAKTTGGNIIKAQW